MSRSYMEHCRDSESPGSFLPGIGHIKEVFSLLIKQYNKGKVMLMIDHEGVLFPFNYKDIQNKLANDYWSDKRLKYEVERLPVNTPLLSLLKDLYNINKQRIIFVSASELDEFEKAEFFNKESIYEEILYRGYTLLQKIGGEVYPLNTMFDPHSLLLFFNDTVDAEGRPPKSLITYIQRTQKHADSLDMLSLPVPRFSGENDSETLYSSIYTAMTNSPKPLKNINK